MTKPLSLLIRCYAVIMLTIFPLWADQGYLNLNETKTGFVWIITPLFLLLFIVLSSTQTWKYAAATCKKRSNKILFALLVFFVFAIALSLILAQKKFETLVSEQGLLMHLGYVMIFMVFTFFGTWSWSYCSYISIAVAANALIATLQVGGMNPLLLYPYDLSYFDSGISYSGEYLTPMGNTNVLSVWLILSAVLCVGAMLCAETKTQRVIGAMGCFAAAYTGALADTWAFALSLPAALLIIGFFTVSSGRSLLCWFSATVLSSGGFLLGHAVHRAVKEQIEPNLFLIALCLSIVGLILVLVTIKKVKAPQRGSSKRWAVGWSSVIISLAATALVLIYYMPTENLNGLIYELHEILRGRGEDSFGSHRYQIWTETITAIKTHSLFGTGAPFSDGVQIEFRRLTENNVLFVTHVEDAHNLLLSWLYHNGIIGTFAGLSVIAVVLIRALRTNNGANLVCGAAVVSYLAASMFCVSGCFTDPLFWMILGFAAFTPAVNCGSFLDREAASEL